jgi:hypothetical protein
MPLELRQLAADEPAGWGWVVQSCGEYACQNAVGEGSVCGRRFLNAVRQRGDEVVNNPCRGCETLVVNAASVRAAEQETTSLSDRRRFTGLRAGRREDHRSRYRHSSPHGDSSTVCSVSSHYPRRGWRVDFGHSSRQHCRPSLHDQ